MRKIFFSLFFLSLTFSVAAQRGGGYSCESNYQNKYNEGKSLYGRGDFRAAAKAFSAANCPDLSAAKKVDLDKWAKKCRDGINSSNRRPASTNSGNSGTSANSSNSNNNGNSSGSVNSRIPPAKPKPAVERPKVEILYSGYLKATCDENIRGAELQLLITAKNVKQDRLRVRCLISPQEGSGHVNDDSPLAYLYTVDGTLSGQEQVIDFSNEECASVTVFVPFGVMDFGGNYTAQMMKVDLFLYQMGETSPIAELHELYEGLSPHTITLGGSIDNYDDAVDFRGGLLDLHPAVCSGNQVLYENLPYWIKLDGEGLHVLDNTSSSPRSATFQVSSSGGGNVINVNISQEGRLNAHATATIKRVWSDKAVINAAQNLYKVSVHLKCELSGVRDKEITYGVFFYKPDGNPLLDVNGEPLVVTEKDYFEDSEIIIDDSEILLQLLRTNTGPKLYYRDGRQAATDIGDEATYYLKMSDDDGQTWITQSGPHTIRW